MPEFTSSTATIPATGEVPRHVAIIMDGNGRWAKNRFLPRVGGHRKGVEAVRETVKACAELGVEYLTLFAFSSENWRRPAEEIGMLMELFLQALERDVEEIHSKGVQVRFIGDRQALSVRLQTKLNDVEELTRANTGLKLVIAVGYGGRWDLVQATRALARQCQRGALTADDIDERALQAELALSGLPDPDLFVRTGGERRISNFLLWNLAYTELYFCDVLWPDFTRDDLEAAFDFFAHRQRRFGMTPAQVSAL
jgi:undecaprenyl diphosphate synthase